MVRHSPFGLRPCLFFVLLFFSIGGYCRGASNSPSGNQSDFRFYFPESVWVFADLDGDSTPDFAGGQCLGHTKDGYFYRVQLQLSKDAVSSSFTVFHNNGLGLKITDVDIDGDDDLDLVISDRFFGEYVGIWLNDGKGHFIKSPPGLFSSSSSLDLAFVAVDPNWPDQLTLDTQQRRLPDYLAASGYVQPSLTDRSALRQHTVEWLFHFAADPLHERAPPTVLTT
jgi:hypothetical protein